MLGNMMDTQLSVIGLLQHAAAHYGEQEIVTNRLEGDIHRYGYEDLYRRSCQLANALASLGTKPGDMVASLAWNTYRHMELYYGISGSGAVIHTVNPRLFAEQIRYVINHAEDSWVFLDLTFISALEPIAEQLKTVKGFVLLCDEEDMPTTSLPNTHCYETLLKCQPETFNWPSLDQNTAASLCYTSGTTGNPKGVLYSHRAAVLHAMATVNETVLELNHRSVILPMVTMYHATAWGMPYAAPLVGAKLVLPGRGMDGETMQRLINQESVNVALGVPTMWLTLHNHLQQSGGSIESLERVCVGGSASPHHLIEAFRDHYNVYWQTLWGMTETGPLVTSTPWRKEMLDMTREQQLHVQTSAGRAVYGTEIGVFSPDGDELPWDGETSGELRVRGPWIIARYFRQEDQSSFVDGWLDTGDIATIDPQGYLRIVDRKKDVIKSGGEWISSLELEDVIAAHPAVDEACVIGVKHPKWDERPIVLVTLTEQVDKQALYGFIQGKIAKWWTPDDIVILDEIPHTGTGKVMKAELRKQYLNHLMDNA